MNTANTTVSAMETSSEIPCEDLDSVKSEPEKNEQSGPSVSTRKTIPVTTPKSNAIEKSKGISSKLFDEIESLSGLIERYFSEPNKCMLSLMRIKQVCESFSNELGTLSLSDRELFVSLKSRIETYRGIFINEKKINLEGLEKVLNSVSKFGHEHSLGGKYAADVLEKFKVNTEVVNDRKLELNSLYEEIEALLDAMLSQLSRIEDSGFLDI